MSSSSSRRLVSSNRNLSTPISIGHTSVRTSAQIITSYFSSIIGGETDLSKITIVCFDIKSKGNQLISQPIRAVFFINVGLLQLIIL